jgi:hypothetical protein
VGLAGSANATITDPPGYYHFTSYAPGTCVDAQYAPPGTKLVMWRCLNTEFEQWRTIFTDIPPSQYDRCNCTQVRMFVNKAMNLCMAVATEANITPADVIQQTCNASDPKQWWLSAPGLTRVRNFLFPREKCLRAPGDEFDNGVSVQATVCVTSDSQELWNLPEFA